MKIASGRYCCAISATLAATVMVSAPVSLSHETALSLPLGTLVATPKLEDGAIVYANKRAEMWGAMRAWLAGGMIPDDRELLADLTGVEYGYALREGRDAIILEKKEDMKKRGLASPDLADALALTFAYPVAASDHRWQLTGKPRHQHEYNPFQQAWSGRL